MSDLGGSDGRIVIEADFVDRLSKPLATVERQIRRLPGQVRSGAVALTKTASGGSAAFNGLARDVEHSVRRQRTAWGQLGSTVADTTRRIGGKLLLGRAALYGFSTVGALALTKLGSSAISAAVQAETASRRFDIAFGRSAAAVRARIGQMNATLKESPALLEGGAAAFAVMARSAGVLDKRVASLSTGLTQAGLDIAAFSGAPRGDVLTAITQFLGGDRSALAGFGVVATDLDVRRQAASQGLGGQLNDQQKFVVMQQLLMRKLAATGIVGAAGQNMAETAAQKWERVTGVFHDLTTEVGTALLPSLKKLADWASSDSVRSFGHDFAAALGGLVNIIERMVGAVRWLIDHWNALLSLVDRITHPLGQTDKPGAGKSFLQQFLDPANIGRALGAPFILLNKLGGDTATPRRARGAIGATLAGHAAIDGGVAGRRTISNVFGSPYDISNHSRGEALDLTGANLYAYQTRARRAGAFAEFHGDGGHLHVVPNATGDTPTPRSVGGGRAGGGWGGVYYAPGSVTVIVQQSTDPDATRRQVVDALASHDRSLLERGARI